MDATATDIYLEDDATSPQEQKTAETFIGLLKGSVILEEHFVDEGGDNFPTHTPRIPSVTALSNVGRDDHYALSDADRRAICSFRTAAVSQTKARQKSFPQSLQEWEGYVTDIFDATFVARLVDITGRSNVATEEAEFPLDDVADGDRALLKPGAVFRWTIGYLKSPSGTKKLTSQIVFRQLPQWTGRDIALADKKAREIFSSISWE